MRLVEKLVVKIEVLAVTKLASCVQTNIKPRPIATRRCRSSHDFFVLGIARQRLRAGNRRNRQCATGGKSNGYVLYFHDLSLSEAEGNSLFTNYYGIWNGKLSKKCEKMDVLRKRYLRLLKAARVLLLTLSTSHLHRSHFASKPSSRAEKFVSRFLGLPQPLGTDQPH